MAKHRARAERSIQRAQYRRRSKLKALLASAAAIPGLGLAGSSAEAQSVPEAPVIRFQWANYHEYQGGHQSRMRVNAPMVWFNTPVNANTEFEGSFTMDSMSGASPYYHSSLTGASGTGIHDFRSAGDFKFTKYLQNFSIGVGGSSSYENDYLSKGVTLESRIWTDDKNTVLSLGVSPNWDRVESSNDVTFRATKQTASYLVGVTQVIDQNAIFQSNLTLEHDNGYLSDPYKTFDRRPENRDRYAWLNRYVRYIPGADASLHTDYRLYWDSWGIVSHTIAVAWYQPFGNGWMIRPDVRYYTQSKADFFSNVYPPDSFDVLYSADQRVSDFGGLTTGLKLSKDIGSGFTVDALVEFMQQRPNFKLGGHQSVPIDPFYAWWSVVGVTKKF